MSSMQAAPVPPATFEGTQGQIDALLASLTALIKSLPEPMKPALREVLAVQQVLSRESALKRPEFSDEYLNQHDWLCGAVWRLAGLGTPPTPFE